MPRYIVDVSPGSQMFECKNDCEVCEVIAEYLANMAEDERHGPVTFAVEVA